MQKVYLHGEGIRQTQQVELPAQVKKKDIIKAIKTEHPFTNEEEVFVFIDEEEEPMNGKEHSLTNKQHLHLHRCKKVQASVMYNGSTKSIQVPPNTKVSKLIRQAADAFAISQEDAADFILKLGNDTLESIHRIGSFVEVGTCSVSLFLTPNPQVKG
jgi:hypothetical protein